MPIIVQPHPTPSPHGHATSSLCHRVPHVELHQTELSWRKPAPQPLPVFTKEESADLHSRRHCGGSRGHPNPKPCRCRSQMCQLRRRYINDFQAGFDEGLKERVQLSFMQSDGGLSPVSSFSGHQAILSGPAGGYPPPPPSRRSVRCLNYVLCPFPPSFQSPQLSPTPPSVCIYLLGKFREPRWKVFEVWTAHGGNHIRLPGFTPQCGVCNMGVSIFGYSANDFFSV